MMFDSKNVLITGAGRGIGRALAMAFAKEGAFVGCLARTHGEVLSTVEDIQSSGAKRRHSFQMLVILISL